MYVKLSGTLIVHKVLSKLVPYAIFNVIKTVK